MFGTIGDGAGGAASIVSSVADVIQGGLQVASNAQMLQSQKRQTVLDQQSAQLQAALADRQIRLQQATAATAERAARAQAALEAARGQAASQAQLSGTWVQLAFVGVAGLLGYVYLSRTLK